MDTKEFLEAVLPDTGYVYVVLKNKNKKGWIHKAAESAEAAVELVNRYNVDPINVYFACATYKQPHLMKFNPTKGCDTKRYRLDENWFAAKAFWIDIDVGEGKQYPTKREAFEALKSAVTELSLPKPMVVDSGGGLHVYWRMTKPIKDMSKWKYVADYLFKAMVGYGLKFDTSRTRDCKSVLRVIGTFNRKGENERAVKLATSGEVSTPKDLYTAFKKACAKQGLELGGYEAPIPEHLKQASVSSLVERPEYPDVPKYADDIADRCLQVARCRETKGDIDYPVWRPIIGILGMAEPRERMHEWSEGHEDYSYELTEIEYAKWVDNTSSHHGDEKPRPATCKYMEKVNPSGCEGCPYKGNITTPLQLGLRATDAGEVQIEVPTAKAEQEPEVLQVDLPAGYQVNKTTIFKINEAEEDGAAPVLVPFSNTLVYPVQRLRKPDGTYRINWVAHSPHGEKAEFSTCSSMMNNPSKLLEEMGRFEVTVSSQRTQPLLTAYLRDSVERLKQRAAAQVAMPNFGWIKEDTEFVFGNRVYKPDGTDQEILLIDDAQNKFSNTFEVRGSFDKYCEAVNSVYQGEGNEYLQYAYSSGFGSLLNVFGSVDYYGLLMLLSGETGRGKTTVAFFNVAAFGETEPVKLSNGKQGATQNAMQKVFGILKNLPMLIDEFTAEDVEDISALAYSIVEGKTKERLKSDSSMQETLYFRMTPYITANVNLQESLSILKRNVKAQQARILHLPIDMAIKEGVTSRDGMRVSRMLKQARENRGTAGEAFIKYIVKNRDRVKQMVQDALDEVTSQVDAIGARFYYNHWACTITAAKIIDELGILKMDIETVKHAGMQLIKHNCAEIGLDKSATGLDAMQSLLDALAPHILNTEYYLDSRGSDKLEEVNVTKEIKGRHIRTDEYYANHIMIRSIDVKRWCQVSSVDMAWMRRELRGIGVLVEEDRKSLGRGLASGLGKSLGTPICWVLDMDKYEALSGVHTEAKPETKLVTVKN